MPQDYGMNNTPFGGMPQDWGMNNTPPPRDFIGEDTPPSLMQPPVARPPIPQDFKNDYFKDDFNTPPPEMFGTAPPMMQPPVAPPMIQPPMMQPPMQLPMSPEMSMSMEEQLQLMYPENLQQAKLANTRKPSGRRGGRATGGDTDYTEEKYSKGWYASPKGKKHLAKKRAEQTNATKNTVKINKDELMSYTEFMSRKDNNENALKYGMFGQIKDYKDYRDYKEAKNKKAKNKKAVGGDTDNNEAMLMEIVQKDPLATEVVMFIQGESDNEQALAQFVEKYGNELFLQLREAVLQNLAPGAQTEGLVEGVGNGGMDDDLNGTIGNQEKIAVSQDEFIVPADVVSMLGDGSSDAGSEELYAMMDRVRQTKTGTTEQAPKLANAGGLLPR